MKIITATTRVTLLVENILDRLFYNGPKRSVAKLILYKNPEVQKGIAPQSLRSEFPNEFSIARASSFRRLVLEVKSILLDFFDDEDNIVELAALIGSTPEEVAETCRSLIN